MPNNPNAAANLKNFTKGDPRINRNGRPKSFDALRKLAQQIATEDVKQNGQPLVIDGHKVTVIEAVMRALASSKNSKDRELFLKYAYGSPPQAVELTGKDGGPVASEIIIKYADDNDTSAASGPTTDTRQREAV